MSQTIEKMTKEDLEGFIEQKLLEILGDPDGPLELREDFKKKLKKRLEKEDLDTSSHEEVMKEFS